MKIVQAPRASAILYNILTSQSPSKPWLLPANICPIVPITFMKARIPFRFVDISAETLHMDLDQGAAEIATRHFGGILYAHTYGDEFTPEDFFAEAKSMDPEVMIVDDRCLCIPVFEVSSHADVVLFSTGYAKVVELDFGGFAFLNEEVGYQSEHLEFNPAHHTELEKEYKAAVQARSGFEYRDTDWLQTDGELPEWDVYRKRVEDELALSLAHRRELNRIYSSRLREDIQLQGRYQNWRFNIRVSDKEAVLKAIFDAGLFASSHYASLAGIMSDGDAPAAQALADEVINLFNDHHITPIMAERACRVINEALRP